METEEHKHFLLFGKLRIILLKRRKEKKIEKDSEKRRNVDGEEGHTSVICSFNDPIKGAIGRESSSLS